MPSITTMLQHGAENYWLFIPSAIILGALHGLEPGHSKTMMAAFIIAIRGTVAQAVMLGIAATLSHTAIVWAIALAGIYFGNQWRAETTEPYFQLLSASMIVGVAAWMMLRTWRHQHTVHHSHDHDHPDHPHHHQHEDAHALAHAKDIRHRFGHARVTNGQIIAFGLTGGLIPCPASITVLLLCLQLKRMTLGATLVFGFSVGLALTLVFSGVLAALSIRHLAKRWAGLDEIAHKAPYISSGLIMLVGLYVGYLGIRAL